MQEFLELADALRALIIAFGAAAIRYAVEIGRPSLTLRAPTEPIDQELCEARKSAIPARAKPKIG
jgi:hypothetical protein